MTLPLYELDRHDEVDHLTTLYVPPLPAAGGRGLPTLQETVARLRAPDGCPWDREQTHRSLRSNLLEETYEVLAALDAEDDDKLAEELGDLLMQVAMHVQIATEEGAFRFGDVIAGITLAAYLLPAGLGDASLAAIRIWADAGTPLPTSSNMAENLGMMNVSSSTMVMPHTPVSRMG